MSSCDTLIRNARIVNGTLANDTLNGGGASVCASDSLLDVAILGDRIAAIGASLPFSAKHTVEADGLVLAPGFIDAHTHDDLAVVHHPAMLPKISQGVTTVIVGNCGISAAPVMLSGPLPDPMNLLGAAAAFCYPTYGSYVAAVNAAHPAVNVAGLVGHTALRSNHMDRLDRAATSSEVAAMRLQTQEALEHGACGLSTGLAYLSAFSASTEEVLSLANLLAAHDAIYATHMRSESEGIRDAIEEALHIGEQSRVPVVISHLKCAGIANWGRSLEILTALDAAIDQAQEQQQPGWDCYPYAAGSSTLDLRQVDERVNITVTWSEPYPEMAGQTLGWIAASWQVDHRTAAMRLQPAGAIYHSIAEEDMVRILQHPATMIGSDGLPNDPLPHPRLWGTFPRVLGRYSREQKLFPLATAVHKMTGLPAQRFRLRDRGLVKENYFADLVLFDPQTIRDTATYAHPISPAEGIVAVWVNGALSYGDGFISDAIAASVGAGRFLAHGA